MADIDNSDRGGDTNGLPDSRSSNSTPDIVVSPSSRRSAYLGNLQTPTQFIQRLQEQLNEKIKQTQLTAELGQDLLKQQDAISKRMKELEQVEGDVVSSELKDKLNELEEAANALDTRTRALEVTFANTSLTSKSSASDNSGLAQQASTPSRNSRRQRNAARNHEDMEFVTSIGQSLLGEVKKLQALLQEKEDRIKELENEKADLERNIETINRQLRAKEESEDALKTENDSLYGEIQTLEAQVKELTDNIDKLQKDVKKGEKALAGATDLIEQLKAKEAKLSNQLDDYKKRHDEAMNNNRKLRAAMKREIDNLEKLNEELMKELDKYKTAKKPLASAASGTEVNDAQAPGHTVEFVKESVEIRDSTMEALQNARRMMAQMKVDLQKEKNEKLEIKELLQAREEEIESLRNNLDFVPDPAFGKKAKNRNQRRDKAAGAEGEVEDDVFSDDVMSQDGYDEENINKNNRPSSDMFRRGPAAKASRPGSNRSFRKTVLSGGQVDEQDEEEMLAMERDELITGEIIKRDADGNVISQSTDTHEGLNPNEVEAERAAALSLLTKGKSPTEQLANSETRHGRQSSIGSLVSSAESFASAKESNTASASRRESALSLRNSSAFMPPRGSKILSMAGGSKRGSYAVGDSSNENDVVYADAGTQTDLAKLEIGTQTVDSMDSMSHDENRFTLDLSSKSNVRGKGPINTNDVPPRQPFGPPEEMLRRANIIRPSSPRNITQSGSALAQQKTVSPPQSLAQGSRSVSGTDEIIPKVDGRSSSPDHKHSPSSVSTTSTDSTATDRSRPLSGSSVADLTPSTDNIFRSGTETAVIQYITQTMIGEFMYKYTRRKFGAPTKRNRRFFWVHPFTKILYWSDKDPGGREGDSKVQVQAAYIAAVRQENDSNPFPEGVYDKSIVVMTRGGREIKFTAKDKERHDLWYQALQHLAKDTADAGQRSRAGSDDSHLDNETTSPNGTLRSNHGHREIKKKSSFSQLKDFLRRDRQLSTQPPHHLSQEADLSHNHNKPPIDSGLLTSRDVTMPDDDDDDGDFEVENVRECCGGRHDIGTLKPVKKKGYYYYSQRDIASHH